MAQRPLQVRRCFLPSGAAFWRWSCLWCADYGGGRDQYDALTRAERHCAEHPRHRSALVSGVCERVAPPGGLTLPGDPVPMAEPEPPEGPALLAAVPLDAVLLELDEPVRLDDLVPDEDPATPAAGMPVPTAPGRVPAGRMPVPPAHERMVSVHHRIGDPPRAVRSISQR